jgi:hypothetical protein
MPDWLVVLLLFAIGILLMAAIGWLTQQPMWTGSSTAAAVATTPAGARSPEPYGPGSAEPLADGSAPAGYTIKGNADSMLYHTSDSPYYGRTVAEAWFRSEADAERAGFRRWDRTGN